MRARIDGPQNLPMNPMRQESSAKQAILGKPIPVDFVKASPCLTERSMRQFDRVASAALRLSELTADLVSFTAAPLSDAQLIDLAFLRRLLEKSLQPAAPFSPRRPPDRRLRRNSW